MKKIINPFLYIAGAKALLFGLLIILATAGISYYSHIHFPDVISVKTCSGLPFYFLVIQGGLNWLVPSLLFYLAALIFSGSSVRAIDVLGTQALARAPYLLAAMTGFGGLIEKFGRFIMNELAQVGEAVDISNAEMAAAITLILITLLLTVWMVTLMVNAYKVSANIKDGKLAVIFVVVMIISIVATIWLNNYLIQKMILS